MIDHIDIFQTARFAVEGSMLLVELVYVFDD